MTSWRRAAIVLGLGIGLLVAPHVRAMPMQVVIDTSALSGVPVQLAFDLLDGGLPANSVTVSGFGVTGGLLSGESSQGDVVGSLGIPAGVTLGDTQFFNEHLADVTLGSSVKFTFDASANAPAPASFPDSFSFYMLDKVSGLPLFATGDPGGALFALDITGAPGGQLTLFDVPGNEVQVTISSVPESASALLLLLGLAGLGGWRRIGRNPVRRG